MKSSFVKHISDSLHFLWVGNKYLQKVFLSFILTWMLSCSLNVVDNGNAVFGLEYIIQGLLDWFKVVIRYALWRRKIEIVLEILYMGQKSVAILSDAKEQNCSRPSSFPFLNINMLKNYRISLYIDWLG
ncbi:hypothetical protein K443DRAFT_678036 [Laccaria amethystina LaAM-08-1]|uniref:Uncharacterized protein n=1 Tax=Laccaria amethystina LaAM-08-1 TaxID=1095629 RepID=A0A0C9XWB2_9AGAR|nr:hypothetical protein K443DRAFT_678036 [Laccaria amethystina LaAM-08-1]